MALVATPLVAADKTLLFIDDHHVLYQSGTRQVLQPAQSHTTQPVIGETKPWELAIGYCSVIRNPQTEQYQAWYQSYAGGRAQDPTRRVTLCYAESADGIQWNKPDLDLFPFNDKHETNIVLVGNGGRSVNYGAAVVLDANDAETARRYKLAYWDFVDVNGREVPGLCVAFSPDGIHWSKHPSGPLLQGAYGNPTQPPTVAESATEPSTRPAISDVIDLMFDPVREAFVIYSKTWIDGPDGRRFWKRAVVRSESKNFTDWSEPEFVLAPESNDSGQIHGAPAFYHHGLYLGLIQRLDFGGFDSGGTGDMPGELASSRDGIHWQRRFQHQMFLPVTGDGKSFDAGCLWTNATPVVLRDELRFYYGAYVSWNSDMEADGSGVGMRRIPRDRFVALEPCNEIGQVTLRRQQLTKDSRITINADASVGSISVELLNAHGYRLANYTKGDANPIESDHLRHPVKWKEQDLSSIAADEYQIRIHLQNAKLFGVTITE